MNSNLDLKAIQAGAVILASTFSMNKIENMDNEALYRYYQDEINRYFKEIRHGVLFNGQIIGEASLEEEKLEKELFMTYLFWPNDEEFLNVQMTKSDLVTKMLKGVNERFDYLNQPKEEKLEESVVTPEATQKAISEEQRPQAPIENDDLETLAQGALASFKGLSKECENLRLQVSEKANIIEQQKQDLEFLRKEKEENKAKANEYINKLMAKINDLQNENEMLNDKVAGYEKVMPNIKEILASMQNFANSEMPKR